MLSAVAKTLSLFPLQRLISLCSGSSFLLDPLRRKHEGKTNSREFKCSNPHPSHPKHPLKVQEFYRTYFLIEYFLIVFYSLLIFYVTPMFDDKGASLYNIFLIFSRWKAPPPLKKNHTREQVQYCTQYIHSIPQDSPPQREFNGKVWHGGRRMSFSAYKMAPQTGVLGEGNGFKCAPCPTYMVELSFSSLSPKTLEEN